MADLNSADGSNEFIQRGDRRRARGGLPMFVRSGTDGVLPGSNYFLDLADETERAVRMSARGWRVVERPAVGFIRPKGLLPLPLPARNGSIDLLRSYLNLSSREFRRAVVWLVSALLPGEPHPILIVRGAEGTAKSTTANVLKALIDPHRKAIQFVPESARHDIPSKGDRWVLAYDDVGEVPNWFCDALDRMVRGPKLDPSREPSTQTLMTRLRARPVILSGVESLGEPTGLTPISISLNVRPILFDHRRAEHEFWESFEADRARILGGLLDVLVEGLALAQARRRPA
jgi:hypothetical protein